MSIRKVAQMGNPILRTKSKPVQDKQFNSEELKLLLIDMMHTLEDYPGTGLAAIQVHEPLQIAIMYLNDWDDQTTLLPGHRPVSIFINPTIKILDKKVTSSWEGCLSIEGMRGLVERHTKIRVTYYDFYQKKHTRVAQDLNATIIQHELDHLNGVLYIDRLKNFQKLAFNYEFQKFHQSKV